jgi:thiamine biosynthesis lipoprotein
MTWCKESRIFLFSLALLAAECLPQTADAEDRALQRFSRSEIHMGVEFEVVLYAANSPQADAVLDAAFDRIVALDKALSDYNPESELSLLSGTSYLKADAPPPVAFPTIKLSPELWEVLSHAQELSAASDGAFDVTIGPLTKLWRRARRQKALPEPELFAPAKAAVGWQFLELDAADRSARLTRPNMRLDLGGIAKGYAADEALAVIRKRGISRALVRASGDIAAGDPPPGESGWLVGIAPLDPDAAPTRYVRLANRAISTSGDSRQHVVIDGRRYSHLIDPRTGLGISGRSSVSVIAPRGMTADGLASAVAILGPEQGRRLVDSFPGAELFMIHERSTGETIQAESDGFRKFASQPPQ